MPEPVISVLDGSTFVVSDRAGDIRPDGGREQGFFSDDTRFVSRWVLRIDGAGPEQLGLNHEAHYAAQFFLTPAVGPQAEAPYSLIRRRCIDRVWMEELTVLSHTRSASDIQIAIDIDVDFADLFEVKDTDVMAREITWDTTEHAIRLAYVAGDFERSVTISASQPATFTRDRITLDIHLKPGEVWTAALTVTPCAKQRGSRFAERTVTGPLADVLRDKGEELERWLEDTPELRGDDRSLLRTYRASLTDLAALRLQPDLDSPATLPAAGLPWFMALFGRDSLITSYQALPYLPELAATTLRVLADRQATVRDDFHEQEPGKILHEQRFGEQTSTGQRPHSPYYGSADATPLFVVLLDEYHRWTGDDALVRALEPHARAALAWMDDSGDADGDGYVEYLRRNVDTGLVNQCWKDSWDSMQFADGTLAQGPIATSEIQGYVYDARRRAARLARDVWGDPHYADRLEAQASELRDRFHEDFWMPDRGCFALALDGNKRQVDSLTSNNGHLLWSGVVGDDEAAEIAERLLEPSLYSGWGVRTLAASEKGYNPLGYHTGTVWPHENALIVAGLARYGHVESALALASAILSAAPHFDHRLPEVFAGYPASLTTVPVAFPTASRPQAWSAGAPLMLLTTLLDLKPGALDAQVIVPGALGYLSLHRHGKSSPSG